MRHLLAFLLSILSLAPASAQTQELYIKHSSGLVLTYDATKDKGVIVQPSSALVRPLVLKENTDGTCTITYRDGDGTERYLALSGSWNTTFQTNAELNVDGIVGKQTWEALDAGTVIVYTVTVPHLSRTVAEEIVKKYGGTMKKEGDA